MARMLGRVNQPWCPVCKTPPGPDCPVVGERDKRAQRHVENRQWQADIDPWDDHVEPDEVGRFVRDHRPPPGSMSREYFRADPEAVLGLTSGSNAEREGR